MRFEAHAEITSRERAALRLALERFSGVGDPKPPAWSMASRGQPLHLGALADRDGARSAWQEARDRRFWPDRPWRPGRGGSAKR